MAERRLHRGVNLLALALPAVLAFVALYFLLGDFGFWADDYFNSRRGSDGKIPPITFSWAWPFWSLAIDRGFFIRPLYYQVIPPLTTLLWEDAWALHLIQAVLHVGVTVLVWRLMIVLGIGRKPARIAALVFLVYPASYEVVYWAAALPTTLSVAVMLCVLFILVGFVRRGAWWCVPVMGVVTFVSCCLNEQPAAVVAAMPLLYWAAMPAGEKVLSRRHVVRSLASTVACGIPIILYTVLLTMTALPGVRGSAESFMTLEQAPYRLAHFVRSLGHAVTMRRFASGAWKLGVQTISVSGVWAWIAFGAFLVTGVAWALRRERAQAPEVPHFFRRWAVVLFGAAFFVVAWIPVVAIARYEPDSRTRYWPFVGAAIALAAGCTRRRDEVEADQNLESPAGGVTVALRCVLVAVFFACTVMHIGIQAAYRHRWRWDMRERAQLVDLIPEPKPMTVFQPLGFDGTGLRTGTQRFDASFNWVWWYPWTPRRFVQGAYQREDITALFFRRMGDPVLGGNEQGMLYGVGMGEFAAKEEAGCRVPWDRVVPFVVDADGLVHIVTVVVIDGKKVDVPQGAGRPPYEFVLPRR